MLREPGVEATLLREHELAAMNSEGESWSKGVGPLLGGEDVYRQLCVTLDKDGSSLVLNPAEGLDFHESRLVAGHQAQPSESLRVEEQVFGQRHASGDSPAAANRSFVPRKPCIYFSRGFCKHGSTCRFLHSLESGASSPEPSANSASSISRQHPGSTEPNLHTASGSSRGASLRTSISDGNLQLSAIDVETSLNTLKAELRALLSGRPPISIATLPQLYFKFFNKPLQMEGYLTESQRRGKTAFNLSTLLAKLTDTVKLVARPNGQHEVQLVAQLVEGDASALASVMASHAPQPPSRIAASDYDFSLAARAGLSDCLPMNGPSSATTSGSGVDNAASCMAMVGPLSSSVPDGTYDMLSLAATLNGLSSSGARFASSSALSQLCELSSMVGHGGSGLPLHRSPSTPTLSMLANAFSNSTLASSPAPIGRGVMSARGAGGAGIPIDPLSKLTLLQGTPLGARVAGTTGGGSSGGNVATPAAPGELCGIYLTFANAPDLEGLGVDDLRRYFGAYGTVLDARIPKQPRSKIGGFAFVIFDTPGAADAALAEERHVIGRVQVLVKPYREGGKKAGVTGGSGNGGATGSSPPTGLGLFGPHGRPLGPNGKSAPSPLPGMSRGIDIHGSSNSLSSAGTSGSSASPPGSYSPTNDNAFLSMAALGASGLPPGMSIAHRSGPLPLAGGGVVGGGLSRGSAGYVGAPGMMAGGAAAARLRAASFGSDPSSGFPPMVVDAGEYELLLSGVMRAQAADLQSRSAALQQQQQLQRLQNQQAAAQQLHQQQAALLQQQQQLIQQQQQRVLLAAQEEQRVLHQQQASLAHLQQQQQQQAAAMSGLNLAYARGGPLPPAATDLLSSGRSSSSGSLNTLSLTMPGSSSHEDADADPSVWDSARSDGNRLSQAISSASSIGPLLDAGNRLGGPLAKGVGERLLGEGAPRPPAPQRAVSQRCADAAPVALGGEMDKSFFGCGFPWTPGTSLWGTGTLGLTSMSAWNPAGQTDEAARRLQANW